MSANTLLSLLKEKNEQLCTAESVSGGEVHARLVKENPGISAYLKGGMNVYTQEAKLKLGVSPQVIAAHGLVSLETTKALAQSALHFFEATLALATTGYAPPVEDSALEGTAFLVIARKGKELVAEKLTFSQERPEMIQKLATHAVRRLIECLKP